MAITPSHLLDLIDRYALARAARDDAYDNAASWAFSEAHEAMLEARAHVVAALGVTDAPPLTDDVTCAAEHFAAKDAERAARIDRALS